MVWNTVEKARGNYLRLHFISTALLMAFHWTTLQRWIKQHSVLEKDNMENIFPSDFKDFICCLNKHNVDYILVGGFSVILHGYPRTTGDMDIWVKKSLENFRKIEKAFFEFGMPLFDMTLENFLFHKNWDVFTFGRSPVSIDLMVEVKGLNFEKAFESSVFFSEKDFHVRTISKQDLIKAKESVMRPKDMDDLQNL